jgi:hypothetical protein
MKKGSEPIRKSYTKHHCKLNKKRCKRKNKNKKNRGEIKENAKLFAVSEPS